MKREALVVVHLSSLDAYTSEVGEEEAFDLAWRIYNAVNGHDGPVFIIDQHWDLTRHSRARKEVYAHLVRPDVIFFKHDEDVDPWPPLLARLRKRLRAHRVRSVLVGGLWFGGCVNAVADYLRRTGLDAEIDFTITGGAEEDDE